MSALPSRARRLVLAAGILAAAALGASASLRAHIQASQPSSLPALLEQYQHGDADSAVRSLAGWEPDRVAREEASLLAGQPPLRALATLALLDTEAGIRQGHFGQFRGQTDSRSVFLDRSGRLNDGFEVHSRSASRLVRAAVDGGRREKDRPLLDFCGRWYQAALAVCASASDAAVQCAAPLARQASADFPDDAEVLVAAGAVSEAAMVSVDLASMPLSTLVWTPRGYVTADRYDAERLLRHAIERNPSPVEARLRLGRVLSLIGRTADAQKELERAATDSGGDERRSFGYLANLFLGQLHEEAGRSAAAVSSYERAISLNPTTVVTRVALGQLLIRSGRPDEGWAVVRRATARRDGGDMAVDPYYQYRGRVYALSRHPIEGLRAQVRQW